MELKRSLFTDPRALEVDLWQSADFVGNEEQEKNTLYSVLLHSGNLLKRKTERIYHKNYLGYVELVHLAYFNGDYE